MLQKIRGQWIDPEKVCTLEVQDVVGSSEPAWTRVCFNSGMTAVPGTVDEVAGEINAALRDRVYRGQVGRVVVGDLGLREKILASKDSPMVEMQEAMTQEVMTHARQCDGRYHWKELGAARCQCGSMKVDLPPEPEREIDADLLEDAHTSVGLLQCGEMIGAMRCQLAAGHGGLHVPFRGPKCPKTWNEYGWIRSCVLEAGHVGGCLENYASEPHKAPLRPGAGKEAEFIDEELCQPHEHFQAAGKTKCLCGELTGLDVAPYRLLVNPRPAGMMRLLNKED